MKRGFMKDISTYLLIKEIKEASNVSQYIERYKYDLDTMDFVAYINYLLRDHNLRKSDVIRDSFLHRTYAYQVFSGLKSPSRDKVIMLAYGFKLDFEQTQKLLTYANVSLLYPKAKRDALITYALMNHYNIDSTNIMLYDMNQAPLQ